MATKTKAELEAYIKQLEEKLDAVLAAQGKQVEAKPAPAPTPSYVPTSTDVTVVYTSHSKGHMEGNQFSIDANVYGEEFTLSRTQFDELAGKYRHWFEKGILAVSCKSAAVAAAKGLPIDKDNGLSVEELHNLGSMTPAQIEELWNKCKFPGLRMSIVTYYKEKFLEGAPGYRERARVDVLNRLTEGGFDAESVALSGKRYRVHPIDLVTDTEDDE
jgi:hypothetical protein